MLKRVSFYLALNPLCLSAFVKSRLWLPIFPSKLLLSADTNYSTDKSSITNHTYIDRVVTSFPSNSRLDVDVVANVISQSDVEVKAEAEPTTLVDQPIGDITQSINSTSIESTYTNNVKNDTAIIQPEQAIISTNITNQPESTASTATTTAVYTSPTSHIAILDKLTDNYKNKFICVPIPQFPYCDIYLCGTLHVAKTSSDMVADIIRSTKPHYVILELCETRADSLYDFEAPNITLSEIIKESFQQKSIKVFGMGLLSWMQLKSAKLLGNKLGGEIIMAAQVATEQKALGIILGDRLYATTIQRVFDTLTAYEKVKVGVILFYEVITMSFFKLAEYIKKTENDEKFIKEEIVRFRKFLPSFARVIIDERDEYLAQSIFETARVGFGQVPANYDFNAMPERRGRILAVVGAGHLEGIKKYLLAGGVSDERINEISTCSKQNSTWPGKGILQVVNMPNAVNTPSPSSSPLSS